VEVPLAEGDAEPEVEGDPAQGELPLDPDPDLK